MVLADPQSFCFFTESGINSSVPFNAGARNCQIGKQSQAVRSRIDWKYALGLELTDPGFDFSILCEFRARVIAGGAEQQLLDSQLIQILQARIQFKEQGCS